VGLSARPAKDAVPPLSTRGRGTVSQVNRIPSSPATIPHAVSVQAIGPVQGRRLKHQACVRLGLEVAATYGLRVRRIRSSSTISALLAGLANSPVRNPQFAGSTTEHHRINDYAICGFHMGCGLTIRRLKKKGPRKGPGKGPTPQSDNLCCRLAARNLLQRNDFRVGRRGLEPRTYGLKGKGPRLRPLIESSNTNDFSPFGAPRDTPRIGKKGRKKGRTTAPGTLHRRTRKGKGGRRNYPSLHAHIHPSTLALSPGYLHEANPLWTLHDPGTHDSWGRVDQQGTAERPATQASFQTSRHLATAGCRRGVWAWSLQRTQRQQEERPPPGTWSSLCRCARLPTR
jgi:hypothetical protein